ncbi:MAG: hypothetical protein V3T47_05135 [Gammaproteobacteria bacterium]
MRIGKVVLFVCAGAGIAWLANVALLRDGNELNLPVGEVSASAEADALLGSARTATTGAETSLESAVDRSVPQPDMDTQSAPERETSLNDFTDASFQPLALSPDSKDDALAIGESTGNVTVRDPVELAESIFENLIDPTRIRCVFDPGGGGSWTNGTLNVYDGAYQGGPIVYDSVNIDSGTARMTGSVGATGSRTGEVDVRITATGTGLHFSGFMPDGTLVVTTIFGAMDGLGRYIAVMSRHGGRFPIPPFPYISSQFYGACD